MIAAFIGPPVIDRAHMMSVKIDATAFHHHKPPVMTDRDTDRVIVKIPFHLVYVMFIVRPVDDHGKIRAANRFAVLAMMLSDLLFS